jgi:UDP-N-acetyl-D-mannosaminuronate dehydrogenase
MALRAGFIGLGNQGKPIAANLVAAGFETVVFDVAAGPVAELVAAGAKAAGSPREVGERADVVCVCVPEDRHVREVVAGERGVLAGAARGAVVAIHSTILPETALAWATPRGVSRCSTPALRARRGQPEAAHLPGRATPRLERAARGQVSLSRSSRGRARERGQAEALPEPDHLHPVAAA